MKGKLTDLLLYAAGRQDPVRPQCADDVEALGDVLMPSDWKEGVIMELAIYENIVEVKAQSLHTGIYYPRGYYRFE